MKIKSLTLILITGVGLLTGCDDDDNLFHEKTINGTWNLINKHGGLAFIDKDYSKGDIKWIFDESNATLTVENKIGNDNAFMLHSGTFDFNIEQNSETQILFVNNNDYRMVILSIDNDLIITDDLNDGFTAEFKR